MSSCPVKYLVLNLKRFRTHSEILGKVSSDVFGLTSFLERLLGQLLDLDACRLFLIPVGVATSSWMRSAGRLPNASSKGVTPL